METGKPVGGPVAQVFTPTEADLIELEKPVPNGLLDLLEESTSTDFLVAAKAQMAAHQIMLKSQGELAASIWTLFPDGQWQVRMWRFRNRAEKFLLVHKIAESVAAQGVRAVILVGDSNIVRHHAWNPSAPCENEALPKEALSVKAVDREGRMWSGLAPYRRTGSGIQFEPAIESDDLRTSPTLWPFLRAWGLTPPD